VIVVFDTSFLFSAFAFRRGLCGDTFRACLGRFELATSEHILDELGRHLIGKTDLLPVEIDEVVAIVRGAGSVVTPSAVPLDACRDSNDLPVLGTALAAGAAVLVTGDKDLLVLGSFSGVTILSPRQFHDRFIVVGP
jgi:putative PIN family toxin of toxin-antitoxin system